MKMLNTRKSKLGYTVSGALLLLASGSASASKEISVVTPFTMTVITDVAHGKKVESGKYDVAVDQIT